MKEKRVSISEYYAGAMYEWWLALKQAGKAHERCGHCIEAARKLEGCIGKNKVRWLKTQVKKHPYFKKDQENKL